MSGDKGEDYISDDLPVGRPSKEKASPSAA